MLFNPKPVFLRILKHLPDQRKAKVKEAVFSLAEYLERGKTPPAGLGLKLIHRPYWEIRSTLADRILFAWIGDSVEWLYVGSHDDIKKALKNLR